MAASLVPIPPWDTISRYGRTVAWLYVGDVNVNEAQVRAGMAWWYQTYAKHETQLRKFEQEARTAKRGLWSEPNPLEPWKFRSEGRAKSNAPSHHGNGSR